MNIKLLTLLCLLCSGRLYAEKVTGSWLYKGMVDGKMPVTLYVHATDPCGGHVVYDAIYRYDKQSRWLLLQTEVNDKDDYCLTESDFTGVLILHRTGKELRGVWISPDRKRTLNVVLNQQLLSPEEKQKLDNAREQANYEQNDC